MANVLLMPVGSHGDVHPYIALGQALQARGHEVTLLTSAYFEPLAKKAGLPFVGIGTVADFLACLDHPDAWHPYRAFRVVAEWGILGLFCLGAGLLSILYPRAGDPANRGLVIALLVLSLAAIALFAHNVSVL